MAISTVLSRWCVLVFWRIRRNFRNSITDLAIDVNENGKTTKETFKKTLKWLSNLANRWLLVVDNVDQQYISGNIKEVLLGTWKRCTFGHIIITTRREQKEVEESLSVKAPFCISLDVFDVHEAIDFVTKRTRKVVDEDERPSIELLVNELGCLPLALEQASAHIKNIRCSFTDYIQRFQKKRLKLLKTARPTFLNSDKRLAVETTWQLNIDYISHQSDNERLGNSAVTVMKVTSFLFADEIPQEIINIGRPTIEDIAIVDTLENRTGLMQVMEILTRFSLFQSVHAGSLSVHRLVQEVIRDSMDENEKKTILQKAIRMVNFALHSTCSPYTVLYQRKINRGSLLLWSKMAANANILRGYLVHLTSDMKKEHGSFFNLETINMLQTTAVFQSLHQRQDRALADQKQMLLIMTTLDIDKTDYQRLTSIKIPLFQEERKMIQDSIAACITDTQYNNMQFNEYSLLTPETLRTMGNEAFRNKKYQEALQFYTEAIRACSENNIDFKILSNRSLVYIRLKEYTKALEDANRCIEIDKNHWKAYCWKAYAIAGLIDKRFLPENMKSIGLASASIAAFINKSCLLASNMKINYPIINYKSVEYSSSLGNEIMSLMNRPFTTLILKKGKYRLDMHVITTKSVQIIGREDDVEIDIGDSFFICPPLKEMPPPVTYPEEKLHAHFENVFFVSGGAQIIVTGNAMATFYQCKFSNGKNGCEDFPKCKGERGCLDPQRCRLAFEENESAIIGNVVIGQAGQPGIAAFVGGIAYLDSCVLDRCGGGGALANGDGSLIEIKNCTVRNMRQTGIEARNGGTIKATNNLIIDNQLHGVAIGPKGIGFIHSNTIQCNGQEGIYSCCQIEESRTKSETNSAMASKAVITENVISQNGLSGISFDGGVFEVKSNKIFDNWLWGLMIKVKSSCYILNNDIFENKCGGIRIGYNFSASVLIDGNTIRDHTGPDVYALHTELAEQTVENIKLHHQFFNDETIMYSRPPVITSTNVRRNNNKGVQHPRQVVDFITTCCFCRELFQKLKTCSKCKKATYCSKECQSKHWIRHKHICKLLRESYIVEIRMKDTIPFCAVEKGMCTLRIFDGRLKGIREGLPPDKKSSKPFIVKIQNGQEYSYNNKSKRLLLYDQSVTLDIFFVNPTVYHLANECGVLAGNMFTTKKIFCWASFKNNGDILCIHTDNLPPFQTW